MISNRNFTERCSVKEVVRMNIKVAIVQSENLYNHLQQNIVKMELQIKEAANKDAQIVVFPELSACGYIPNQSIWKYAEELGGNLTKWCCDLSKKLEIYIGVGFIEKKIIIFITVTFWREQKVRFAELYEKNFMKKV